MGEILVELLPLLIGAAILPAWIIIVLFLLRSERGVQKAIAFVGGAVVVRLAQGIIFGFIFDAAIQEGGQASANTIKSTLLLIVGVVLLVAAARKWMKEADLEAPPPGWKEFLRQASPIAAFGVGALLMAVAVKQWVFTLSAISVIEEGELGTIENILVYVFFTLAAQSLMLTPVLATVITPSRSQVWLNALEGWLERNERVILIGVSLIFGLWFLWKGIAGLTG